MWVISLLLITILIVTFFYTPKNNCKEEITGELEKEIYDLFINNLNKVELSEFENCIFVNIDSEDIISIKVYLYDCSKQLCSIKIYYKNYKYINLDRPDEVLLYKLNEIRHGLINSKNAKIKEEKERKLKLSLNELKKLNNN